MSRNRRSAPTLLVVRLTTHVNWDDFDAALFDLDGVLTPTAEVHMRAWQQLFTDFLTRRGIADQPYVESDYFDYIDGKPRYDGVRSFLASRGITLRRRRPVRRPGAETVCGLGNRKNVFFSAVLGDEGVQPYPGSVAAARPAGRARHQGRGRLLLPQRPAGARSRRSGRAGSRWSSTGNVAGREHLPGKPAPDTFVVRRRPARRARSSAPSSSRTRCPGSRPAGPATSAWSSGSTGGSGPTAARVRRRPRGRRPR